MSPASNPVAESDEREHRRERGEPQDDHPYCKHPVNSLQRREGASNVNITPKTKRCCVGVSAITPGLTS